MKVSITEIMDQTGVGFGTSGARGLVDAMSDEVCFLYTVAFLQYLRSDGQIGPGCEVAVAGDLRTSTPRIMAAVIRAIESHGYQPLYCGTIPSPAVALLGIERQIPAIMVTGSHIPDDRNGIKFNKPAGEILKPDEEEIRRQQVCVPEGVFDTHGFFVEAFPLPKPDLVGHDHYIVRYQRFFATVPLQGRRVGVYEHSGVARDILAELLELLGAKVTRLGRSEQFVPVDTEAIRPEDIKLARKWVNEHQLDALVSTDGDGDRPLVSNEQGEWLRGDVAGILTAAYLDAQGVVTPVSSNSAVEKSGWFEQVIRTRIGSPYVIEGMMQAMARQLESVVGYEANGGFLQATPIQKGGQILAPLPTRDALIVILSILAMSCEHKKPISALVSQLPARYTHSDRIKAFPQTISRQMLTEMSSGDLSEDASAFERLFGNQFGSVLSIDQTDGVRLSTENGEVIHLRASGNAPELRCYTEADSAQRAAELNRECLTIMERWKGE